MAGDRRFCDGNKARMDEPRQKRPGKSMERPPGRRTDRARILPPLAKNLHSRGAWQVFAQGSFLRRRMAGERPEEQPRQQRDTANGKEKYLPVQLYRDSPGIFCSAASKTFWRPSGHRSEETARKTPPTAPERNFQEQLRISNGGRASSKRAAPRAISFARAPVMG